MALDYVPTGTSTFAGPARPTCGTSVASLILDKPLELVKFTDDGDGGPEVKMYSESFASAHDRKASPLNPEVALESAKLACGAEISIRENHIVTGNVVPAV